MNRVLLALAGSALTLSLLGAEAQAPSVSSGPLAAAPAAASQGDPLLLPADDGTPPLSFMLHPTGGAPPPGLPRRSGADTTPSVPMNLAYEAARAALDACAASGHMIGAAVVDAAGQLHVGLNADGAPAGRIFMAARKAVAAAAFGKPTSEVRAMVLADPGLEARLKPNMALFPGAVPLMAGEKLLGAIGASGASSDQDEKCAAAGAAAIKGRLK
jgi:uncharacterized protein GlcG (DUF336 family)